MRRESKSPQPVKMGIDFYSVPALELAENLIGKILVRRFKSMEYRARIVETEAYIGTHDLACHAAKGRTARTEIMFGPAGRAYVYLIYGMHDMLNIVAGSEGDAQAVLIRAAEPLDGWEADLSGPGKLAKQMHITRKDNGVDLLRETLFVLDDAAPRPTIATTRRIGVDYAGEWKDSLFRFIDVNSKAVSKLR